MVHSDLASRVQLADGKSHVTDLDVQTLTKANAILDMSEADKGVWAASSEPVNEDWSAAALPKPGPTVSVDEG